MSSNLPATHASSPRGLHPVLRVTLAAALILALQGLLPAQAPSPAPGTATPRTPAASTLPQLPVVAKPPTDQPAVGLAADTHLDKTPVRKTKGLDLIKMGWTYNCMECHKLLPARWSYDRPMAEHQDVHLEHGNNRFCLNCHHATNRNVFADYDGSEIAQSDVVLLCAKCHGTTYRDWKAGVHGRSNGFWKADLGNKTKLRCIQCHDPHSPKFPSITPLAPLHYPLRAAYPPDASAAADPHSSSSPALAPAHRP